MYDGRLFNSLPGTKTVEGKVAERQDFAAWFPLPSDTIVRGAPIVEVVHYFHGGAQEPCVMEFPQRSRGQRIGIYSPVLSGCTPSTRHFWFGVTPLQRIPAYHI